MSRAQRLLENVWWRGGSPSEMPRGVSAYDIIQYEREDLRNDITPLLPEHELKRIPASHLLWVCRERKTAQGYGKPCKIVGHFTPIARDNYGGFLVRK
jgi:hypothetical protein